VNNVFWNLLSKFEDEYSAVKGCNLRQVVGKALRRMCEGDVREGDNSVRRKKEIGIRRIGMAGGAGPPRQLKFISNYVNPSKRPKADGSFG
jgi:hypothetical protein